MKKGKENNCGMTPILDVISNLIWQMFSDAAMVVRGDGRIEIINRHFSDLTGYSLGETLGKTTLELKLWSNPEERAAILKLLVEEREVTDFDAVFCNKTGDLILTKIHARRFELRKKPYYIVVIQEIRRPMCLERKNKLNKDSLLLRSQMLLAAASLVQFGPWEYNAETDSFLFGDDFYAIYGTSVTAEGRIMSFDSYVRNFVYYKDAWVFEKEKDKLLTGNENLEEDVKHRIVRRDGDIRTVLVRRRTIVGENGELIKAYGVNQDITEREEYEKESERQKEVILQMAYYDFLTGLPNRRSLCEKLSYELAVSEPREKAGSVFLVDLDEIKFINDNYGHSTGDHIIETCGKRIVGALGPDAFVSRVGGDEFMVVLPEVFPFTAAEKIAQELLSSISMEQEHEGAFFYVTASIGIACYPKDGETVEDILKFADIAMYAAKADGKNRWKRFSPQLLEAVNERARLQEGLRGALKNGEMYLEYQPQYHIGEESILGVEALLRWESERYGSIPPTKFIPVAEQAGFIYSIGKWALQKSCRFAARLADLGLQGIRVSVNVSVKQLAAGDFVDVVRNAVSEAGIQPEQLELEVTESLMIVSIEDALSKLNALKEWGVHLSLDDFGTGFSSLTYLRRFPFRTLKIDKSFVAMIEEDVAGAKVIGTIIRMASDNNMNVVAEGVETKEQLEYLKQYGCECIQGYYFSKPMREDDAIELLQKYQKIGGV